MTGVDIPRCDLASNESPIPPSSRVIDAIAREAAALNRYPAREDAELRAALAAHHGRGLTPAHLYTALSGYEALDLLARALLAPGDEVILGTPTFHVYAATARLQQASVVDVPLIRDSFAYDLGAIRAAVTDRTRLVYLCNPGNPTGQILRAADMSVLVESLPPRLTIVADEVYYQYVHDAAFPDSIGHVLDGRNLVIVHSFSKTYSLAGLRLGYAIARPELVERISRFRRTYHLSRLHIAAGLAALVDVDHVRRVVALADEGKAALYAGFDGLGIRYWPSAANFLLFKPPRPAGALVRDLAARGVHVRTTDGSGLPDHVRVTVGLPEENRRLLQVLSDVLAGS